MRWCPEKAVFWQVLMVELVLKKEWGSRELVIGWRAMAVTF